MAKLLILDRDGTITQNGKRPGDYINHHSELEPIPGASEAIAHYAAEGWKVAVASNQGGVAKGFITLDECTRGFKRTMQLFLEIECCVFCPDAWPEKGDRAYVLDGFNGLMPLINSHGRGFRKPEPGMLLTLIKMWSASEMLYVGDRPEDEQAAQAAGIPFMWADEWRTSHE